MHACLKLAWNMHFLSFIPIVDKTMLIARLTIKILHACSYFIRIILNGFKIVYNHDFVGRRFAL